MGLGAYALQLVRDVTGYGYTVDLSPGSRKLATGVGWRKPRVVKTSPSLLRILTAAHRQCTKRVRPSISAGIVMFSKASVGKDSGSLPA